MSNVLAAGQNRRGFTLVEAMAAIVTVAIIGAALLLAVEGTITATSQALDRMIAEGIAKQYLDEAFGLPYVSPTLTTVDPNAVLSGQLGGSDGPERIHWDAMDDFAGPPDADPQTMYVDAPPHNSAGENWGSGANRPASLAVRSDYFDQWRVETNVNYVNPDNLAQIQSAPSYYRLFEVRVFLQQPDGALALLAHLKRIHSHVPKSP